MDIITQLKSNDEKALRHLFNRYEPVLFKYLLNKTKSEYQSKEIVQLSFIKLWKFRHHLSNEIDISHQIFRIARTTLIDELRKAKTKSKLEENIKLRSRAFEDLDLQISYNDTKRKLHHLISSMPAVRQKVFLLSRFNCYSYKEIASLMGISTKTVETHINLALKSIRPHFYSMIFIYVLLFCK